MGWHILLQGIYKTVVAAESNLTVIPLTVDIHVFPTEQRQVDDSSAYWVFWRAGSQERGYLCQGNITEVENGPKL